jgi:hypothetical protein
VVGAGRKLPDRFHREGRTPASERHSTSDPPRPVPISHTKGHRDGPSGKGSGVHGPPHLRPASRIPNRETEVIILDRYEGAALSQHRIDLGRECRDGIAVLGARCVRNLLANC